MDTSVLVSTFLLTLLLAIGLFFFIRASVKDRTQVVKLKPGHQNELTLEQLEQYFAQRAYRLAAVDEVGGQLTLEGIVRPSLFLAVFLTLLCAIGILCLALVLSFLVPALTSGLIVLVLLAPAAGIFYWRGARRPEQVLLKIDEIGDASAGKQNLITVTAHRDEIQNLQQVLSLVPVEPSI